jgi:hypothetical protein
MRFSFSEWLSGKKSSNERMPTNPLRPPLACSARLGTFGGSKVLLADRAGGELRPLDLAGLVHLEDVAVLDVVEAVEQDAALEALGDLARVLLEPLELGDGRLVDDRPVADDPDRRAAAYDATPDVTMQPAIVPSRETLNSARTSASPRISSVVTGVSMPTRACSMSCVSW